MKRIIAAALLLSLSFTAAFVSNYLVTKTTNRISDSLKFMADKAETASKEELCEMSEKMIDEWERSDWIVHAMINTDSVFEVERSIEMLSHLAEAELKEEFRVHCIDAYCLIKAINKSEKINKQNIF